jgi:hypothetical protein
MLVHEVVYMGQEGFYRLAAFGDEHIEAVTNLNSVGADLFFILIIDGLPYPFQEPDNIALFPGG